MKFKILIFIFSFFLVSSPSVSIGQSLSDILQGSDKAFQDAARSSHQRVEEQRRRAAQQAEERARNRDRSNDVCYQMPSGSDAQTACFGEFPFSVRDERARNILLGHCSSLGSGTYNSNLSYVCSVGTQGCSVLSGDASYWCQQCGGTRRWLAVYSLGHTIQCFN